MFKLLGFLVLINSCFPNNSIVRNGKLYLNLGQSYVITNKNVSFYANFPGRNYSVVEIETCPSCAISINFLYLNLEDDCMKINHFHHITTCRCDYIWIEEPSYEELSGTPFCGYWNGAISLKKNEQRYKSRTKAVVITFFYRDIEPYDFTIYFISERNRKYFSGNPQRSDIKNMAAGFLTSPFFPANYPRDLVSEYIVSCVKYSHSLRRSPFKEVNPNISCTIRLLFMDFQLSSLSVLEIFDGNQERIGLVSGLSYRPSVIVTNSSRLRIRFTANGGQGYGFKAMYSFIGGNYNNSLLEPNTDCGGLVEDLGGVITMANTVHNRAKVFDCVWLIRPSQNYFGINGNLYLKVNTFANFDYAEMEIRDGLFSESPLVEKILYSSVHPGKEHVTSLGSGFYINLKAIFGPSSALGITFTSFHYNKECFTGPEFLCLNDRCVPRKVVCDGFDHCGDGSDESEMCYKGWPKILDRKFHSLTPNYYLRKVEHFSELKSVALTFIVSSLGLILLSVFLIIFLYKMGWCSRQQATTQNRLHTITEFLDDVEVEEIINDDPPTYEDPPDYEAAIKETAKLPEHHQISISPGETKFFNGAKALSDASRLNQEKCHHYENTLLQNNVQRLPDSSPPPYHENENKLISSTSGDCSYSSISTDFSHEINNQDLT